MTENDKPRKSEDKDSIEGIPEMHIEKYSNNKKIINEMNEPQKEIDKTKKELDKLKAWILKKFPFTQSISILPPQVIPHFVQEEEIPKEAEKYMQIFMIVPEEKFKEIPKIKKEIIVELEKIKEKTWLQIKTPVDLWEICFDSKFELIAGISLSMPLHDTGILQGLRVAEIHKSLVLQKFEKYVVSYVLGGSLIRGDVTKESDVDVFVVINDTDVKRMPRLELKERLRGIIYQYIAEATALAGVKQNVLNVQVYLLTDFWESVKDANPVMFTFIRDGVPIYDRGTFMPWKALLKMGKLKPSPEAIDMFMSMGDKTVKRAKLALLDIVIHDIYWSVLTPAQAMFMLNGLPPPTHKEILQGAFRKEFVEKEKMIEPKYAKILEEIVGIYKDYEHEKIKEIKGAKVDQLIKDTEDFLKRMETLRKQIDKRAQEKTVEQINKDIFDLLKQVTEEKNQNEIIKSFEKNFVKKGKFTNQHLKILHEIIKVKQEFKKGKSNAHKVDDARKGASILINSLTEYLQRKDMALMEKKSGN
ncbi:MAG: nucleotidyltransferase domain-containing protein [Nanoarchaeota archaeon]|nr:nucleotidyltransferase domain-containing protein [Nanoarchaeota archaeon]